MGSASQPQVEEVARLLATAVNAMRLYPACSQLRARAVARFTARANEVTSAVGPLHFVVDPEGFHSHDGAVARGSSQVASVARSLHTLQVGRLIIAHGLTEEEASSFVGAATADPVQLRREGGLRARLVRLGIRHLAVIEVNLRDARDEDLTRVDLVTAPLDEIAEGAVAAAQDWASSAALGSGRDGILEILGGLENGEREVVLARTAEALMRVDASTRTNVLAWSLRADPSGARMSGMTQAIARMSPSALAHLFSVAAAQTGTAPDRLARAVGLPPELAYEVELLLAPSPIPLSECGVPETLDHVALFEEVTADSDRADLEAQLLRSDPTRAAGRALTAAVAVSHRHPEPDTVAAIATALPLAARSGAFASTRIALRRLDELASLPALGECVSTARSALADPAVLTEVCRIASSESEAAIVGEILGMAGSAGTEALVDFYDRTDEEGRALMRPVLRTMSDSVLGLANRRLRGGNAFALVTVVRTLPALADNRVVPTLMNASQDAHSEVRLAAVRALAETPTPESRQELGRILTHWDPETQRFAAREIGRVSALEAVPAMLRSLQDINIFRLNDGLKTEIVRSLTRVGSAEALPTLRRISRRPALRRASRELRSLARRAVLSIEQAQQTQSASALETDEIRTDVTTTPTETGAETSGDHAKLRRPTSVVTDGDGSVSDPAPPATASGGTDERL